MAKCTIENTSAGPYLCRCAGCGETFTLDNSNALGKPMWQFMALAKGFEDQHKDCEDKTCEGCDEDCQFCMGEECRLCPNSHRDGNCDHDSAQRHGWDI